MSQKTLMVLRTKPGNEEAVARAFAEHDQTNLPRLLGARTRTLYRFHDLYIHLVESEEELVTKLYHSHQDPLFEQINTAIAPLVSPYDPSTWRELRDNVAEPFYFHSFV